MQYNKNNLNKAKSLRSDMTKEEVKLWNLLRAKRFDNCKFRRQVLIGNYIVDFVCIKEKLVIELDGGQHTENGVKKYDLARTRYLESQGYKVLRFWNDEVWNNIEGVCKKIKDNLSNNL